jgi:general secretion pathway protein L
MRLTDFVVWYSRQMLDLLPIARKERRRLGDASIVELCSREPGTIVAVRWLRRRKGVESELGRFTLDEAGILAMRGLSASRQPVLLRLLPDMLLERDVVLPLAAERDVESVLGYEMDRNTPFRSEEVFWAWSTVQRDAGRARLHLRLSAVPKGDLKPILAALEQTGLSIAQLEARSSSGALRMINLHLKRSNQPRWKRPTTLIAVAVCTLLVVATAVLPLVLQSLEREAIEQKLAELRPRVAQAEALRRADQVKGADADVFATERARVGNVLQVLATVTDILPDNTFLTDLSLHEGRLGLEGQSGAAARLIAALSNDPVIHNPVFSAPVTRLDGSRNDQFSIRAEITR